MKLDIDAGETVFYTEYKELLGLYVKQMIKTDELQRENTVLYNRVLELQGELDCGKLQKSRR